MIGQIITVASYFQFVVLAVNITHRHSPNASPCSYSHSMLKYVVLH